MERHFKVIACVFILVFALRLSTALAAMVEIPFVWDQTDAENVAYYNIYISTTQDQFDKVYKRVTRLPSDKSPVILRLPADAVDRYVVVTAIDTQGQESGWSNQLKFTPAVTVNDLGN